MPIALVGIGLVLLIATIRDTQDELFALLKRDFTGPGNFFSWILAIGLVGSLGYVKELRPIANAFIVLIILIFLLAANKGGSDFFSSLVSQLQNRPSRLGEQGRGAPSAFERELSKAGDQIGDAAKQYVTDAATDAVRDFFSGNGQNNQARG